MSITDNIAPDLSKILLETYRLLATHGLDGASDVPAGAVPLRLREAMKIAVGANPNDFMVFMTLWQRDGVVGGMSALSARFEQFYPHEDNFSLWLAESATTANVLDLIANVLADDEVQP